MLPTNKPGTLFLVLTFCLGLFAQNVFAQPAEPVAPPPAQFAEDDEAVEMLTRGALHEAFADQVSQDLVMGVLAPVAPPEPIEELPPEIKPEGDDIQWIPGYWYWDDQRGDYIWISGVWRKTPPGHHWVPGYWTEVDDKYRRVSGLWSRGAVSNLEYLPYPPDSLERGPSSPPPSDDYFWAPGCWVYYNNGYSWRPGHWERFRNNWVWMPTRYVWSPGGCLYQSGYWDYPFASRGQLYSPVYFHNHVYQQPSFRFQPSITISTRSIFLHLFVRSGHSHYYFGNYYDNQYHNQYYPWYDYRQVGRRYDPLITHAHGRSHRAGVDYVKRMRDWNHYFSGHADHRPPTTIKHQRDFERSHKDLSQINQVALGRSIQQTLHDSDSHIRSHRTSTNQQEQLRRHVAEVHALTETRRHDEARALPRHHGGLAATLQHGLESGRDGRDDDAHSRRDRSSLPGGTPGAGGRAGPGRFNPEQIGAQRSYGPSSQGGRPSGLSSRGDTDTDHDHPRPDFSRGDRIGRGRINRVADGPTPASTTVENQAAQAAIAAAKATSDRLRQSAQPSFKIPRSTPAPRPATPSFNGRSEAREQSRSPVPSRKQTNATATPPVVQPSFQRNAAVGPRPVTRTPTLQPTTPAPATRPATPAFNGRSDAREQIRSPVPSRKQSNGAATRPAVQPSFQRNAVAAPVGPRQVTRTPALRPTTPAPAARPATPAARSPANKSLFKSASPSAATSNRPRPPASSQPRASFSQPRKSFSQPRASFSQPRGATAQPRTASPQRQDATPNGRPSFSRPQPSARSRSAAGPQRSFSSRGADVNGRRPKRNDKK